jgi:hypothetical protein
VNFDLKLINNNPNQKDPTKLVVGWWDDSDFSPAGTLKVFANGVLKHTQAVTANGSVILDVASWNLQNAHLIEAVIIDGVDNHQYYTKPYRDILPPLQPGEPIPGGPIGGGTPGG